MNPVGVLHLTDTLEAGGAERVAVNVANLLPRDRYRSFFCTTRRAGPLAALLADDVEYLSLHRRNRFDLSALTTLAGWIRRHDIRIIHAHSTSVFVAELTSLLNSRVSVIWHEHYGRFAEQTQPAMPWRLAGRMADGVITVNEQLADWAAQRLRVPTDRVWYLPNFVSLNAVPRDTVDLPGRTGARVICVANIRPEKDHVTLIRAFARVARELPWAQLILAGETNDLVSMNAIRTEIDALRLDQHVTLLGRRDDVSALVGAADVGVLCSIAEGFPMALLEYGCAGLPVIATRVGQCSEILDFGRAGILIPTNSPERLAAELVSLLMSPARQRHLGTKLRQRVANHYSADKVIDQLGQIYETVPGIRNSPAIERAALLRAGQQRQ